MPAIESHTGLLRQTIPNYQRRSFVNISNTKQYYTAFPAIQRNARRAIENKWDQFNFGLPVETKEAGGYEYRFNVQVGKGNTFAWVDMNDPVNLDFRDHQVQATALKRQARIHWSYNEFEMAACRGPQELVSLLKSRSLGSDQDFADAFENWFWGAPPASTDKLTAWPLRYWIFTEEESSTGSYSNYTSILSAANQNFLALNHNSYSGGPGSISRVTYPQWGNANCQYTAFTDDDLIDKLTNLILMCNFYSPVDFPDMQKGGPDRAMYTTTANVVARGRLARLQNDANTSDPASRVTESEVFRVPMMRVPHLDTADFTGTTNAPTSPIYGVDWTSMYWCGTRGFMLDERLLGPSLEAPTAHTHLRYLQGNLVNINPRCNFVVST